jgi:hypothetical protein
MLMPHHRITRLRAALRTRAGRQAKPDGIVRRHGEVLPAFPPAVSIGVIAVSSANASVEFVGSGLSRKLMADR